jgi:hypothetical protein
MIKRKVMGASSKVLKIIIIIQMGSEHAMNLHEPKQFLNDTIFDFI